MSDISLVVFLLYLGIGIAFALFPLKYSPRVLMIWSIGYIIIFTGAGILITYAGKGLNDPIFELIGQTLLAFFAIVGGAMFSAAWNDIRRDAIIKNQKLQATPTPDRLPWPCRL